MRQGVASSFTPYPPASFPAPLSGGAGREAGGDFYVWNSRYCKCFYFRVMLSIFMNALGRIIQEFQPLAEIGSNLG